MANAVVAVMDDDPEIVGLLETTLQQAGYTTRSWMSGLGAFEDLVREPPDLLILDLGLDEDPEAGWHILGHLRAERRTQHLPVILLSGNTDYLAKRDWIMRTRKHAFPLAKPFRLDVLLAQVRQGLEGRWGE